AVLAAARVRRKVRVDQPGERAVALAQVAAPLAVSGWPVVAVVAALLALLAPFRPVGGVLGALVHLLIVQFIVREWHGGDFQARDARFEALDLTQHFGHLLAEVPDLQVDLALDRPLRALFRHDGVAHLIESMIPAGEVQFELYPLVDIDWGREEGGCWLRAPGRGKFGGSSDFRDRSRPSQDLRHRMQTQRLLYIPASAGSNTGSRHSVASRVHVMNRTSNQSRRSFRREG